MYMPQVSLQQTSQWASAKFSQLLKVLMEKQELTQSFLEQQQASTVAQAETRLSDLQEKLEQLKELQEQISNLCGLPDFQLIQVETICIPYRGIAQHMGQCCEMFVYLTIQCGCVF